MAIGLPTGREVPQGAGAQVTMPSPLEGAAQRDRRPGLKLGFSLFWRTFFLLALPWLNCIAAGNRDIG